MKEFLSKVLHLSTLIGFFVALFLLSALVRGCSNFVDDMFDGVSQEKQDKAKNILLTQYPNFESEVQQKIRSKNPLYTGSYVYHFRPTESDNIIIVKYGVQGVDLLEVINPFSNSSTTEITIAVTVDLIGKTVDPVECIPDQSWWSSQKTTCH